MRFDQNLLKERIDQQMAEEDRTQKTESGVRSEAFSLCGVTIVGSYEVLVTVRLCYN
jgi:hypothetical protein